MASYSQPDPAIAYQMVSFPHLRFKRDVLFGDLEMLGKYLHSKNNNT